MAAGESDEGVSDQRIDARGRLPLVRQERQMTSAMNPSREVNSTDSLLLTAALMEPWPTRRWPRFPVS